jgi:cation diffusion facilitator CzcD-associated flavoprotein CzcO
MEQYARHQELVIWMRSTVVPTPSYDPVTKRWTVDVLRDGQKVTLHPYHIVLATGLISKPLVPSLPGQSEFQGDVYHGLKFKGGSMYAGQKAVVIGAGNTA